MKHLKRIFETKANIKPILEQATKDGVARGKDGKPLDFTDPKVVDDAVAKKRSEDMIEIIKGDLFNIAYTNGLKQLVDEENQFSYGERVSDDPKQNLYLEIGFQSEPYIKIAYPGQEMSNPKIIKFSKVKWNEEKGLFSKIVFKLRNDAKRDSHTRGTK
jgi:hypothetical protein